MAGLAGLVFLLLVLMAGLSDGTVEMTGIFLAICLVFPLPFFPLQQLFAHRPKGFQWSSTPANWSHFLICTCTSQTAIILNFG
jgi:hypothetical protein